MKLKILRTQLTHFLVFVFILGNFLYFSYGIDSPPIQDAVEESKYSIFLLSDNSRSDSLKLIHDTVDSSAGSLECYKIVTPAAVYYLEKNGAGLSSMLDRDGNDWISFHPTPGSGAAGEYRGFPNAVHQQDGSYFHPKNQGTDPSSVKVMHQSRYKISIQATSDNGSWQARWDFYPGHCTFTMMQMPEDYKYWILYEGTPGGSYDDTDWWMTSDIPEKQVLTENHEGDIPEPEWIAFGDQDINRVLFLLNHEDDDHPDRFYQMEKQMTVFGFGRDGLTKFLNSIPQSFSIGFLETTIHTEISEQLAKVPGN